MIERLKGKNFKANLYFIDSMGNWRMIGKNLCGDKAIEVIHSFCEGCGFRIYYTRMWEKDDNIWFDVGSHTEFFVLSNHTEPELIKGRDF